MKPSTLIKDSDKNRTISTVAVKGLQDDLWVIIMAFGHRKKEYCDNLLSLKVTNKPGNNYECKRRRVNLNDDFMQKTSVMLGLVLPKLIIKPFEDTLKYYVYWVNHYSFNHFPA